MKQINSSYTSLSSSLHGTRSSAETVVNVAMVEFRSGAVVFIKKKMVFNVTHQKISATGSHFGAHFKSQKLEQLTGPRITCDSSLESLNTVVTLPELNLPLSDSEKSVLSEGLNSVAISRKTGRVLTYVRC